MEFYPLFRNCKKTEDMSNMMTRQQTKIILVLISVLLTFKISKGQVNSGWADQIYINLVKTKDSLKDLTVEQYKQIARLQNICDNHKIIKDSADMFLIVPFIETKKQSNPLWIKKCDFIKINIRQGNFLTIYSDTDTTNALYTLNIKKEKLFGRPSTVINWRHGWYKINLNNNGTIYQGWIKGDELCPDACTTCS